MNFSTILLQAAQPAQGAPGGSGIVNILMIVALIVVFYFFMIRPQQKKAKEQKKLMNELQKGDKVVTIGGIIGKIVEYGDDTDFVIETEGGNRLRMLKSAISMDHTRALSAGGEKKA
ncbi:MAG: preprotein translocase subunit YajC [Bacteroidia bacterium]|jgi:preprotein translocase subunit YajC|nr:preprotein translocase subunit YajC [Bacteroidia bacterium]